MAHASTHRTFFCTFVALGRLGQAKPLTRRRLRYAAVMANAVVVDLEGNGAADGATARKVVHLEGPCSTLQVRDPRALGRARVEFGGKVWDAKHYWAEGAGSDKVTIFEFDEAIPPGSIELVVPLA